MPFSLEELFTDVFAPGPDEIVTVAHDLPHGAIADGAAWRERRAMAADWRERISGFASRHGLTVTPPLTWAATGSNSGELPTHGRLGDRAVPLLETVAASTIVIAMTEFSASAPLYLLTKSHPRLRVASMPGCTPAMEATGLSADYRRVAERCARLVPLFAAADLVEVEFSTGHRCTFDVSDGKPPMADTGLLPPDLPADRPRLANLPAGEVFVCPREGAGSRTAGEIPVAHGDETVVLTVRENRIVDATGGDAAARWREDLAAEPARGNIAEVAVGCNESAVVSGNVLEDEKAGFHWAYGRSEALGGTVGPGAFRAPENVIHQDVVYARGNPFVCRRLDFVTAGGARTTAVRDGELTV